MNAVLTQSYLKSILRYDPEIGRFFWIVSLKKGIAGKMAGNLKSDGYRHISINGKNFFEHRLAWMYVNGEFPEFQLDHINHNRSDNRMQNLRAVSGQENCRNRPMQNNNSSGVTGVSWHARDGRWRAYIKNAGKAKHLGVFSDYFEAVCARKSADLQYGFHKNHGVSSPCGDGK